MKKVLKEFEFVLSEAINYHHEGAKVSGFSLILKAPGNIHSRFCNKLSKAFLNSSRILAAQEEEKRAKLTAKKDKVPAPEEDTKITGEMIVTVMRLTEDMDDVHQAFKEFMCFATPQHTGSVCLVDGKCIMTTHVYEQMLMFDTDRLLGEYIQNFLIPS
jgi:hypothetical protein